MGLEPAIAVEEPNHMAKAKWFMDYLDCPDGLQMSNDERAIVCMLVREHATKEAQQQGLMMMLQAQAQVMGQQPMMEAQQEQQLAEEERGAAREDEVAAREDENAARTAEADMVQTERAKQAERDQKSMDRDHAMAQQAAGANDAAAQAMLESELRLYEAQNAPTTG